MKVSQLKQLIRSVVQETIAEEIRKRLPDMVESVLTERYLRHLVAEQVGGRPVMREIMDIDDDPNRIPKIQPNNDRGIYQDKTEEELKETYTNSKGFKKLAELNPDQTFLSLFEGVKPIGDPNQKVSPIQQEYLPEKVFDQFVDVNRLQQISKRIIPQKSPQQQVNYSQQKTLEQHRRQLNEIYSTGKPVTNDHGSYYEEDPFEAKMRELDARTARLAGK